jgi:hypothetical protein
MEQLAKDLVEMYPALGDPRRKGLGYQMWFMNSFEGTAASGFLEERLKYQRRKLTKKVVSQETDSQNDLPVLDWDSENENGEKLITCEILLIFLKYIFVFINR